ncbi:TIGR03936 family radical SAM-associated protein [Angustibacter sp. McL0619]|uniref:TIGR03936 family radical SAM-associated protein n=1 Tax=Angustibacter sp. McL0619 TaxID=3415676 RepID=UPI003CF48965
MARQPDGPPPPPVVQKLRLQYAKRGRLRFSSHRDFQRALERALRRADVPMAYSAGFHPHPKISFANAAPTGTASEAEYVELSLAERCDPEAVRRALDESLPQGLDVLLVVEAAPGALADRLEASEWLVVLPGTERSAVESAVAQFLAQERVDVERLTKNGPRTLDAREPVVSLAVEPTTGEPTIRLVVRHVTPTVRPNEVLAALEMLGGVLSEQAAQATRLRQGPLRDGVVGDPLTVSA